MRLAMFIKCYRYVSCKALIFNMYREHVIELIKYYPSEKS